MAIVASKVSEERTDCAIKEWDTTASPENNTTGPLTSHHIHKTSHQIPSPQLLDVSNYP